MRYIDMQNWHRLNHFKFFSNYNHPHFSMCANVDVTKFYSFVKKNKYSFTVSVAYIISRASNAIPEFRQRIRGDQVVEHEVVHPGFSILIEGDIFGFCHVEHSDNYAEFARMAEKNIANLKAHTALEKDTGRDDVLYMSPIPWVSFTSFDHPMQLHPTDSVPRFAWGKFFNENEKLKMPLNVQGHHAVMDGIHMGRYYETVQNFLDHPEDILGSV